jgi:LexA-binding, inner membrane-associated putative hydrolase
MITRHHLSLTLLCTLILCCAFFPGNLIVAGLLLTGTLAGSILPDIQMKKPSRFRLLTLAYYLTRFTNKVSVPVMHRIYGLILRDRSGPTDKRLTHSIPGIFFIFLSVAALPVIAAVMEGNSTISIPVMAFLAGLTIGLGLHLVFDLCTRKGVFPFFPFSTLRIKGSIRPCDTGDHRIAYFHMATGLILIGMIALIVAGPDGAGLLVPTGLAGFFVFMGIIILCSGIRMVTPDDGETDENPLAVRPSLS